MNDPVANALIGIATIMLLITTISLFERIWTHENFKKQAIEYKCAEYKNTEFTWIIPTK
jgi:hypothetical protein